MVFIRTDRVEICVQGYWYNPFAFPAYVFTGYPFRTRNPPSLSFKELFLNGEVEGNFRYF